MTLALGIGASSAIFSVADAVLLQPLPYKDADRLVYACADLRRRNVYDNFWSYPDYLDLRNHASSAIEDAAGVRTGRFNLPYPDGTPEQLAFANATSNIFRVLGARIVAGRDFDERDTAPQPQPADGAALPPSQRLPTYAIVSYELFQRRFGGNRAILGQPIAKNGPVLVGVLQPNFELLFLPEKNMEPRPDIWFASRQSPGSPRILLSQRVIAKLRPGVTLERAQAQADAVAEGCRAAEPISRTADFHIRIEPMQRYLTSQVRPAILALMGAAIFLLLIACSNVANLFLVRASLRARDLAVRTAMGANWWRLVRPPLAEALLIGIAGSAAAFELALIGIHELRAIAPANLPRVDAIRMDFGVLAFTIGAGLASALLFGLAPAWRAARPDVARVLRSSGRAGNLSGGALLRNAVVVAEVALCFVLLVGSGLMIRSFAALQKIRPGFDPSGVLIFRTAGGKPGPTPEARLANVRAMRQALSSIPGVESVTAANVLPLNGAYVAYRWGREDALADASKYQSADVQTVLPGYFETMRVPLVGGRVFDESDYDPAARRMIIDDALAAKAFPNVNAVGQRLLWRFTVQKSEWFQIVGVVSHQRLSSLAAPGREQAYLPDSYWGHGFVGEWAVRTRGDPSQFATRVRDEMTKYDRSMELVQVEPMEAIVRRAQSGTRFSLLLIAVFASIAVLLAGVGLYGVLSTVVRQRTAEIGVRVALGAHPRESFGLSWATDCGSAPLAWLWD